MMAPAPATAVLNDPGFPELKHHIIRETGLAFYTDKDEDLAATLQERLSEAGHDDCTSYLATLLDPRQNSAELDWLIERLTVGETFFFRHAELFEGLRSEVLPDILERNTRLRRLRVWCAGCSNGAEPYSISILLRRDYAETLAGWDISILGTDINRRFLDRAAAGVFRDWDFRGTTPEQLADCFVRRREDWILRPEYRAGVTFQPLNLVRNASEVWRLVGTDWDLILCRNVLIYFSADVSRQVVQGLSACLVDRGWLLVGHAEAGFGRFSAFRTVNVPGAILYQKLAQEAGEHSSSVPAPPTPAARLPRPHRPSRGGTVAASAGDIGRGPAVQVQGPIIEGRRRAKRKNEGAYQSQSIPAAPLAGIRRLANAGDLETAVRECRRGLGSAPLEPELHLCLAQLHEQQGDLRHAEAEFRRTLFLNPQHSLAHYLAGMLHLKLGQDDLAQREFAAVLAILAGRNESERIAEAEELTAGELCELARLRYRGRLPA